MTDEATTPDPYAARAAYLAGLESATWESVMNEGPGVFAALRRDYPERADDLEAAHARWKAAGKPAGMLRTAPVALSPTPRPESVAPTVAAPDPSAVPTMRYLLGLGGGAFDAFRKQHPDEYERLARSAGVPNSR